MVEQAPLKRKVTGSSPVWPNLFLFIVLAAPASAAAPAKPELYDVPTGTLLSVELVDPVTSAKSKVGDAFRGRLLEGVYSKGRVAVPPGATVRGVVAEAVPSGRVRGQSRLALTLASFEVEGSTYAVASDTLSYLGDPHAGKNIGSLIGGALQGAVMGVLFGGAEGAVLGAGAGGPKAPVTVPVYPAPPPPLAAPAPAPVPAPAPEKPAEKPADAKPST
ncbi:MAG: hypothetical protein FD126_1586 [Elusimicrobia bacterium]|nr:MAG: hypothetical protein FD126_1586 [Elusimicrobiota bacterium]